MINEPLAYIVSDSFLEVQHLAFYSGRKAIAGTICPELRHWGWAIWAFWALTFSDVIKLPKVLNWDQLSDFPC